MAPLDQILTATHVERAVTDTLKLWIETYVAHVARQEGLEADQVIYPRSWQTVNESLDKWPEDRVPAMYVIATGIIDPPHMDGDGWFQATWAIGVAAVVEASNQAATDQLAKIYAAAIRGALVQNRSLGGKALTTTWLGESYDAVPNEMRRSLVGAELVFAVEMEQVVNAYEGLAGPDAGHPPDEPGPWLTVKDDGASAVIEPKP